MSEIALLWAIVSRQCGGSGTSISHTCTSVLERGAAGFKYDPISISVTFNWLLKTRIVSS
jgi:hypothetical protein